MSRPVCADSLERRTEILGVPLDCVTMDEAIAIIADLVSSGSPHLVITLGTEMVMKAQQDEHFRETARGAALLVPDSIGVVWAARRTGHQRMQRVAGIDMLGRLAEFGASHQWRFFFLGGKPGVAEEAAASLTNRFSGLVVAGCQDGYFRDEEAVIAKVAASRADILLAAMGSPRQETWTTKHGPALGVPVAIGVGGSFDVLAGRVQRAPRWMIRLHLEWMYRLVSDPKRAGRMLVLPQFALRVMLSGRARR